MMVQEMVIMPQARYLARRGMARRGSQFSMIGPNRRCCFSQWWKRGEARAQQAAASNTNGVVGSTGRKMPMMPSNSETAPAIQNKVRVTIVVLFRRVDVVAILFRFVAGRVSASLRAPFLPINGYCARKFRPHREWLRLLWRCSLRGSGAGWDRASGWCNC